MTVALGRIVELVTDCDVRGARPVVALESVESMSGRLVSSELPEAEVPGSGLATVDAGSVLFGKLRPYLGKSWLVDRPVYASTELLALRPLDGLDSRWLAYLCMGRPFVEWAVATSDGAKMPRTSWEKLRAFQVDLPSLTAQREIVDFLDAETARIDSLIDMKRRLRQRTSERVWMAFEVAARESSANDVPLRRAITAITDGPFGSAFTSADYSEDGAAVVRLGNIGFAEYRHDEQAYIPLAQYQAFAQHAVYPGDLLIAGLGDDNNHAGRACVAPDLGQAMVKGKCFCARVRPDVAVSEYLALLLSSRIGAEAIRTETRGSTRLMINLDIVKSVRLPLPGVDDQARLVNDATHLRSDGRAATSALERQIELLRERRQALITAAVAGQVDIAKAAA